MRQLNRPLAAIVILLVAWILGACQSLPPPPAVESTTVPPTPTAVERPAATVQPPATEEPTATPSPKPSATARATLLDTPTVAPTRTKTATLVPTQTATAKITPTPPPDAVVTANAVNLRAGPDTTHPVRAALRRGTPLDVIARTSAGRWLEVIAPNGTRGWVFGDLVALNVSPQSVSVASAIPTLPRPTPTAIPVAVASPTPEVVAYPAPIIYLPPDEYTTGWPDEVILVWRWPQSNRCGPLGPDEYFDVRVWAGGQQHLGIAWTKACEYSLKNFLVPRSAQTLHWSIAVIRGRNGQWEADLSPESAAWSINWRPPD
ncbi:MAG: SH3 domain-containing protein [Anaerolineae bacterium]